MEALALGFLFPLEKGKDMDQDWNHGRLGPLAGERRMVHQEAELRFLLEKSTLVVLKGHSLSSPHLAGHCPHLQ